MSLSKAVTKAGSQKALGEICGVSQPTVFEWISKGKLPRTEWTNETNYSEKIYKALGVVVEPYSPANQQVA